MKFKTKQEAFNHYRKFNRKDIEKRAAEIKTEIETDPEADVVSLRIEISGLREALANTAEKLEAHVEAELEELEEELQGEEDEEESEDNQRSRFNPITGMNFARRGSRMATRGDVLASAEYRSAFYKKLLGRDLTAIERAAWNRAQTEQRANAFSTTGNTAAVIPTETLNEVISKARQMGGLFSVCRGFNIPANLSIPVGTPSSKAIWNTEGAEVESEQSTVTSVNFGSFEIIKVFSISASVKRMSVPAFESYLAEELASCVLATLEEGLVSGTGTGQGLGILPGITWTDDENALKYTGGTSTARIPTYLDITNTIAKLKRGYANGAEFAVNNATLFSRLYGISDDNKRPIFIQDAQSDTIGKLLGFPVVVDDYLPDDVILFGNFQYMGYNLPEGIAVEASTQSSFKSGRIDYRAMAIADCKPIVDEAFVKLYKA